MSTSAVKIYTTSKALKKIQIACDSQMHDSQKKYLDGLGRSKMIETKDWIITRVGATRIGVMLEHYAKQPTSGLKGVFSWWLKFQEYLINEAKIKLHRDDGDELLLVDKKEKRVYLLSGKDYISEIKEFHAIGSGEPYAIAALELGKSPKEAVEIASKYDLYTGGEVKTIEIIR